MITTDAASIEARYAKQGPVPARPQGEPPPIYAPGMGITPPESGKGQGQIPLGTPVPEGVIITQVVGRGERAPSIMVVPPKDPNQPPAPSMMIVPPQHTGRTTIGTFVEQAKPPVTSTTSNPLTSTQPVAPSGIEAPPVAAEPKPRKKVDLTKLILDHIWELGGEDSEDCQKYYDRSNQTLRNWCRNPAVIPLGAVLKFLDKRPGIKEDLGEQLEPHFSANGFEGWTQSLPNRGKTSVVVCAAVLDRPTLPFFWTCLYLAKKYELGFDVQADTMIVRSRNMLAQRFLKSNAEWSLWLDSDIAAPIANPEWFKWITASTTLSDDLNRHDVLQKLQSHNKAIVGGVYAARRYHGALVMQPEIRPRSHEDKLLCNDLRKGITRGMQEVEWIGFGCALVHREVFLEIQRRFPDLAPVDEFAPWRFFQPVADEGEDEAFCTRVRACAIPIWLDTDLVCGHIGSMAFMPEHTMAMPAM
jgi:hypothetical protein